MQIDEALALRMVRDSAELGLELFHIDAGWFRGVGDWYPSPSKFPHGFAPIVTEAHRRGLNSASGWTGHKPVSITTRALSACTILS